MKKLSIRFMSVVLTVMILSSVLPLSVIGVSAQAEGSLPASAGAEGSLPPAPSGEGDTKSGTYTLDEIYTEYLFSHTDKTSEVEYPGELEETVANANDDKLYEAFKFSQTTSDNSSEEIRSMEKKANEILADENTDNPLAGFSFARPKELLIAQINRESQHKGEIRAVDNVSSPINELGGIDNLANAGSPISLSEEKSGQTHNTIGIDYDGDDVQEFAYFSLYADGDGYASVRTYDRFGSGYSLSWSQADEESMKISDKDDILDIETQQSRGYTSMTAGDFDNDGKEELACYFPCANNGDGIDSPFVGIIDISDDGYFSFSSMKRIYLSSIRSELDNLESGKNSFEDWYMPIVALSTTSIRANGADDTDKSYDDLVINISIPRVYHDDDDNMNSCIAIYSYNNGSYDRKFSKDLRFGTCRMVSTNSVDADLNGDGYNELVVAGLYEYDVSEDKATNKISTDKNLVQLISWDGSSYNFVWGSPKEVDALGNIKVDWEAQEPIALTAGRYNPSTANTLDYLCVQGVVLSCNNTKVYGVEKASPDKTEAHKAVIDTVANREISSGLFADAEFSSVYTPDIYSWCEAEDNAYVCMASSGLFYVDGKTETIALLTGDEISGNNDHMSYDIVLLSCNSKGEWQHKVYDDYIHNQDEDDYGTYMSLCFVDCDEDQFYYRYTGKTVGYSSPTLFSVVQVPPYYKENNSAEVSFTVEHSNETGWTGNWGVGGNFGVSYEGEKLHADLSVVAQYVGACSDTVSYSKTTTLNLYTDTDYAISLVIPVLICTYDVWDPHANNGEGEWSQMSTAQQLEPAFSALSVDEYNALVATLTDEEQKAAAPKLDLLPPSSAGDPYGYIDNMDDLLTAVSGLEIPSDEVEDTELMVNTDAESKENTISVTKNHEEEHGLDISLDATIKYKLVGVFWGGGVSMGGGFTHISSNSDGISFDVSYNATQSKNTALIDPDSSYFYEQYRDSNGKLIGSNIVHYQPADYYYYTRSVAYPSDKLTKDIDQEDFEYKRNKVYILSYCTYDFGGTPPELPEYFGVQSVESTDDEAYSVTLAWKNKVRNKERKADAYNIYVKSINADTVELVNKEGPIFSDTKSNFVMTYKIDGLKKLSSDYVFYIAAADVENTTGVNNSKVINVYEGILSQPVKVNLDNLFNTDGVIITKQPENFYASHIGVEATFSVEAEDIYGQAEKLYYHWQTYNSVSGEWETADNNKSSARNMYVFDTTEDSVGKPIRCLVTKNSSGATNHTATTDVVTVTLNHTHKFSDNGFCNQCGQYQPAVLTSDGVYEIKNGGNLFWFASLVNGDNTHADFDKQNTGAKAVLTKDIDLESREWTPIKDFSGTFDGQNHTIGGLKITETPHDTGLFRSVYGTIKNFTVEGEIIISADGDYIGGVVGYADGATIENVASYVNISNTAGELHHVGGVIGYIANKDTFVDKCVYYGTVNVKNSHDCIGGIVGYTGSGARINNCANHGTVSASKEGAYVGGILGYVNNTNSTLKNCYSYGKVSDGSSEKYCGAIIGWARNYTPANIDNNYYLDTASTLAFGSDSKSGAAATSKNADDFRSGEVAYLLNHKVTDGTQVWYQNIDNGKTPDDYPVFEGGTVYYLEYKDSYSNFYSEASDEFDEDEDGNFIIKTYDDLVKLSNLVRSEYSRYGSANYVLENNIKAPENSKWTQGIGSVADKKPFNGTFNGNGYCIIGLNVDSPEYGGLFETVGENGKIKDLFVFDCDFSSSSKTAGGIAAVNKGTIDHCTSGAYLTSGYIHIEDKDVYAPEFNSKINGELSGGVVGENSGSLIGCRSAAAVSGTQCGGVAGVNTGKIYGCANNGKVGASKSSVSGGLVGKNGGVIESSYNSGAVYGVSTGLIAGINGDDGSAPIVDNVFYISQDGLNAFGTASLDISYDTITEKTSAVRDDDKFANELNSVTDTSIVKWKQNPNLNKGYPTIDGNFYIDVVKPAGNNITVQGSMHRDLNIKYDLCIENSEEYKLLSSAKGKNKILKAYSVSLTDKDGDYIPAELWCADSCKISLPVNGDKIQLACINTEGDIVYYKPDSVENGRAEFTVSHPMSFAVMENAPSNNSGDSQTDNDNTTIQTGSEICGAILLVALLSLTVILFCRRRYRIG